jgi:hypothetical protein
MAILRWCQETGVEWRDIRTRPAAAERLHREFQWTAARRTPQRDAVHVAGPRARGASDLEGRLQHGATAQQPRQSTACRLRQTQRSRDATGRDAALHQGLRAPSRCITAPSGLKSTWDSTHRWMKVGAQVMSTSTGSRSRAPLKAFFSQSLIPECDRTQSIRSSTPFKYSSKFCSFVVSSSMLQGLQFGHCPGSAVDTSTGCSRR